MSKAQTVIQRISYWMGIALSVLCLGLVLAGNTRTVSQLEYAKMPLAWLFGILAIVAFMGAEYLELAEPTRPDAELALDVLQTEP